MRFDGLTQATALPVWGDTGLKNARQKMGGEPPRWMQIFPHPTYTGQWDGKRTTWVTDDESQRAVVEFFEATGNALPIDFEHQTDETDKGVIALAAGRMIKLVAGGKLGLLAECEWNGLGAWVLREGLYYYDSPSFWFGKDDLRIYILRHLALTNNPASEKRMYVTDHSRIDYGMEKVAASARRSTRGAMVLVTASNNTKTNRPLSGATQRSKGGTMKKLTTDFLSSLRYMLGRPTTVTGKEIRSDLQKLMDLIPDTDDMIFLVEDDGAEAAASQSGSTTPPDKSWSVAQLVGETALAAVLQTAAQKTAAAAPANLEPIAIALGVDKASDAATIAKAIVSLKATTVPVEEVQKLRAQLATNDGEVLNGLIAKASLANTMTPYREKEARRLASQGGIALAQTFIESLAPLDLVSQTEKATPPATAAPDVAGGSGTAAAVEELEVASESQAIYDRNMEIVNQALKEGRTISYSEADKIRKAEKK